MGIVKTLLGIVILLAIAVFGFWLYATYTVATANNEMWIKVNSNLPAPLRNWSCAEVNSRIEAAEAPEGCADVWQAAASDEPEPVDAETDEEDAVEAPEEEPTEAATTEETEPATEDAASEPAAEPETEAATTEPEAEPVNNTTITAEPDDAEDEDSAASDATPDTGNARITPSDSPATTGDN